MSKSDLYLPDTSLVTPTGQECALAGEDFKIRLSNCNSQTIHTYEIPRGTNIADEKYWLNLFMKIANDIFLYNEKREGRMKPVTEEEMLVGKQIIIDD